MTTTDPMAGPFMTARDLTDYSDEPGYAILPDERSGEQEGANR